MILIHAGISFISNFLSIGTKGTKEWTKKDKYSSSIRIHIPIYAFKHCFYSLMLCTQSHSLQSVKYLRVKQKCSHKCILPWSPCRHICEPLDLESSNFFSTYTVRLISSHNVPKWWCSSHIWSSTNKFLFILPCVKYTSFFNRVLT